MSTRADAPHRHRLVTIRAAFALLHDLIPLHVRYRQAVWATQPANGQRSERVARQSDSIVTSCQRVTSQIPIALRINPATAQRPAVSSLEV
jgi:hypothetical protein